MGTNSIRQRFRLSRPLHCGTCGRSHWRDTTCAEAGCPQYLEGWKTIVGSNSAQANYIRTDRSRHHLETQTGDGVSTFVFPAGQRCFRDHFLPDYRIDAHYRHAPKAGVPLKHVGTLEPERFTNAYNEEIYKLRQEGF